MADGAAEGAAEGAAVEWPGQSVTSDAQLVTVETVVPVSTSVLAAEANEIIDKSATAENFILV